MLLFNCGIQWKKIFPAVCCITVGFALKVNACLIPVFQYALENWPADSYRMVVRGDVTTMEEARMGFELLKEAERTGANIVIEHENKESGVSPPVLEVFYPEVSRIRSAVWRGPLTRESVGRVIDSPAREKIASHLLDRKAGVWVFLASGNRRNDSGAFQMLEKEVARLKDSLKVLTPEPGMMDMAGIQTEIDFGVVRVDRDDPRERVFVDMLLGMEPDLRDFEDQPIVFPVYGRGLALYALIGKGINPMTLADAGGFLIGPCSCQVKAANPGVDILIVRNWDALVERRGDPDVATPPGGTESFLQRMKEADRKLSD